MEILQKEYIYPTGMKTHPNEDVYIDYATQRPFKEIYPSMYKEGWAFIGTYVEDAGIYFVNDEEAADYIKKKYRISLQTSYDRGYHYYSEWEREAWQ